MKILIIDDSARMRRLIGDMLRREGVDIFECGEGMAALKEYARIRPDVVLMDIAMEPVNGLDASANIKKEYPDARIILVTNYDEPAFRKRAEELGISDYILKENLVHLSELLMGKS